MSASVPDGIRTHDLHRDRVASTPGCSTRTIHRTRGSCFSGSRGTRTHNPRSWRTPVFETGPSSGRMTSVVQPHAARGEGFEPPPPGSKPGRLPLARSPNVLANFSASGDASYIRSGDASYSTKVRMVGFEPTISGSQDRRIPKLSHILSIQSPSPASNCRGTRLGRRGALRPT
jgi:hypothetical protein